MHNFFLVNLYVEIHRESEVVGKSAHKAMDKAIDGADREIGITMKYGRLDNGATAHHLVGTDAEMAGNLIG